MAEQHDLRSGLVVISIIADDRRVTPNHSCLIVDPILFGQFLLVWVGLSWSYHSGSSLKSGPLVSTKVTVLDFDFILSP